MSVHQTSDGRWVCRFRRGRDIAHPEATKCYFGRGEKARQRAELFEASLLDLRRVRKNGIGITFSELAAHYLTAKISDMSETDQDSTYYKLESVINPIIGRLQAMSVRAAQLDQYVQTRMQARVRIYCGRKNGRPKYKEGDRRVSLSTIHRELSIIRAILNWGVSRSLLPASPIAGYKMPKRHDKVILPPSREDYEAILRHAAPHCQRLILLSYYLGLRPGKEVFDLTWSMVDFKERLLRVISARKGGLNSREVPIHPELLDLMQEWQKADAEANLPPETPIIHWNGRGIKRATSAWKSALRRAGIRRQIRPYSLRHKSITDMLAAGGDVGAVSKIAGHSDPTITLRVYQEVGSELKEKAVAGLHGGIKDVLKSATMLPQKKKEK